MTTHGSRPQPWGVGSPAILYLHQFGKVVYEAFGVTPLLVGSATVGKQVRPRDIDVRLVLPDGVYQAMVGPLAECGKPFTKWAAFCMAFSALGEQMTGLPIDFQIQPMSIALTYNGGAQIEIGAPSDFASAAITALEAVRGVWKNEEAEHQDWDTAMDHVDTALKLGRVL